MNLEERKAEREVLDTARLARENVRRVDKGQTPFTTVVAMDSSDETNGEKTPDTLLDRTLQITADIVVDGSKPPPRTLAKRADGTAVPAQ